MTTHKDTCFVCGGPLGVIREQVELNIGARKGVVEVEKSQCGSCGEAFVTPEEMDRAQRALAGALRIQEGLLPPERLIRLREKYGLTQAQMERLLRVGPKTVVRWERGTVFPNAATDQLLRVIEAVPAAMEFLAKAHNVELKGVLPTTSRESQHTRLSITNEARGPQRTVRVSLPSVLRAERRGSAVAVFHSSSREQETAVHPAEEVELPQIPVEALQ